MRYPFQINYYEKLYQLSKLSKKIWLKKISSATKNQNHFKQKKLSSPKKDQKFCEQKKIRKYPSILEDVKKFFKFEWKCYESKYSYKLLTGYVK